MSEAAVSAPFAPLPVAAADLPAPTQLDYLLDSYLFSATARVLSATATELVLDCTIFHPQGGGQPSDVGVVRSADGTVRFAVAAAKKDAVGDPHAPATMRTIVRHAGAYESSAHFAVGDEVVLDVDERVRRLHARLHSAGHLIDVAMERAGYALKASKGSHSPDMAFVEYAGTIESGEMEAARERLQDICSALIAEARPVSAVVVPFEVLLEKCGFVPDYLPAGQPTRIIEIDGFVACPCGGTHIKSTADLGSLKIVALKNNKKNLRVKYELA